MSEDLTPEQRIAISKAAAEANHAAAERAHNEADRIRAETDKEREERLAVTTERKETEYRKRVAALVRAARVKIHPVGLAIMLVVGVVAILLVLRYV